MQEGKTRGKNLFGYSLFLKKNNKLEKEKKNSCKVRLLSVAACKGNIISLNKIQVYNINTELAAWIDMLRKKWAI